MQTILAPTDFSDISLNAVNYAADMALSLNAKLLIVHATEFSFDVRNVYTEPGKEVLEIEEKLFALKHKIAARTNDKIPVSSKQVSGLIENEIIKMCDYKNPLAIVMATHGATLKERFLVGSITVHLSKNIQYPVIVVPQNIHYKPVRKILFATDLENLYDVPVEKIANITKAFKAKLDIVHVYNDENKFEVMSTRISELTRYLIEIDPQFHFIKHTNIYKAITEFARKNHSDIILTIPKKHAFFHKSESKQFIFNAPVTIMTMQ